MAGTKFRRIVVIGTCGSGKTTLAAELARRMDVPHVELDALHWGPNWKPVEPDVFRSRTKKALSGDCWTVDGNYNQVRDIVWSRADLVIWLKYSLFVVYKQLFLREMKRGWKKEVMWGINPTRFRDMFGADSLFIYAFASARKHRHQFQMLFRDPAYAHLESVILASPEDTLAWVEKLAGELGPDGAAPVFADPSQDKG